MKDNIFDDLLLNKMFYFILFFLFLFFLYTLDNNILEMKLR